MDRALRRWFWVVNLCAIALGAFFAARAIARAIEASVFLGDDAAAAVPRPRRPSHVPTAARRQKNGEPILKRNMFCSDCPPILAQPETEQPGDGAPVRSSLPLQLIATLVSDDPSWSFAALRHTEQRKTGLFGLGSMVLPGLTASVAPGVTSGVTVESIEPRRVFLVNAGRREYVDLEGQGAAPPPPAAGKAAAADAGGLSAAELDRGVRKASDNAYEIDRGLVEKALLDPATIGKGARIVPSVKDGAPNGFKIYAIRPGSVYARIGLSNGDTIHAINGFEMTSPDRALEVYTKVRNASHVSVSLTRRGQPMTLDYSIR